MEAPSTLPIPWFGLSYLMSTWSGKGQLYEALAASQDVGDERVWTKRDVEKRANRVLYQSVLPAIERLPTKEHKWTATMPPISEAPRSTSEVPIGKVDWATTTATYGWVPSRYVTRTRKRRVDEVYARTLCWCAELLAAVRSDAVSVDTTLGAPGSKQIDVLMYMAELLGCFDSPGVPPNRSEVTALRTSGYPWSVLAGISDQLSKSRDRLDELAERLIVPDSDLTWRLFHLGVTGELLSQFRERGASIKSLRPLSASSVGPTFEATLPNERLDVWFEASGLWNYYNLQSPHALLSGSMRGMATPLGADVALVAPSKAACLYECKYSADKEYVCRDGYMQSVTYAAEVASAFTCPVTCYLVVPQGVLSHRQRISFRDFAVEIIEPTAIPETLDRFLLSL